MLLVFASAFALSGCAITDIIDSMTGSGSSVSDEPIPENNGLFTYTADGSENQRYSHNPSYSASGVGLANNKITYETVGNTNWSIQLPSSGSPKVLVVPVKVKDYSKYATSDVRNEIYKTFFGKSEETGWESVTSFYYKSSFGKLNIQGAVTDWYDCGYTSSQISRMTSSISGYDPTWTILEDAVSWYKKTYSSTNGVEFDTNHDGFFDAVWLVYGAPNAQNDDDLDEGIFWAYSYFDNTPFENVKYVSDLEKYKSNPVGYHYAWASYDFMYEGTKSKKRDAHTFIHETGHLLGLDDYYVSTRNESYPNNYGPVGFVDMMDANVIDHNSFSKFALGWVNPYVPTSSCTIELKPASTSGEFVLLPTSDGWNGMPFDEYMVLEYYTPEGLNAADSEMVYSNGIQGMTNRGIRIYHVDARLVEPNSSGTKIKGYTDKISASDTVYLANSNTAAYNYMDQKDRLIQVIDCSSKKNYDAEYDSTKKRPYTVSNSSLFTAGKTFSYASYANSFPNYYFNRTSTMNDDTTLPWTVNVTSISNEKATLTITKA